MSEEVKSRKANKQKKKQNKKINWKKVFLTLLIIGLVTMLVGAGVVYSYISDAPELDEEELQVPSGTSILDRNGDEIANLATENRTVIEYSNISPVVEDAVLATEDARFYEHSGIDMRRIGGAIIANVTDGFGSQGASTITQQVIKNFLLTNDKEIERKVQEQYLALKLEREYSKEQILMMYLNKIYYANGIYGVQEASEVYYGKEDLNELTVSEAALLAGIPQRPNAYNPLENPERAEERRNTVLDLMVHHEKITEQEAEEAKQVSVSDMVQENNVASDINYPAFVETVYEEAEDLIDRDDLNIHTAGLTIHTTLDQDAQQQVEELLSNDSSAFPNNEMQAGVTALNTQTGEVVAIGGGRDRTQPFNHNYATDSERGPGSAIKPIVSYGPAIDQNQFSTYHQYDDSRSEAYYSWTDDGEQAFGNYGQYHGWVSMRESLYRSLNVPAVSNARDEIDQSAAGDFARNLGISSIEGDVTDSMPLGGVNEVQTNSYEMAGAYATFGNGGLYNEPHTITEIEFPDSQTMEPDRESTPVMEDYTAYMMSDMLKDTINNPNGTASQLNLGSLPVAGKTGTTDETADSWFTGYSTNYTISVWTGYEDQDEENEEVDSGTRLTIFETMMNQLSEGEDTADFQQPDSVTEIEVEAGSRPAQLPSEYTPESQLVSELFVVGNEPSETSDQYEQIDSIDSLELDFNAEEENIEATWSHPSSDDGIQFDISISADGQEVDTINGYGDTSYVFNDIEMGQTYTFEITAFDETNSDNESEPVTASVEIPAEDSDFWDEFLDDEESEDEESEDEESEDEESDDEESGDEESNDDSTEDGEGDNSDNSSEESDESSNNGNGNTEENQNNNNNQDENNNNNNDDETEDSNDDDENNQDEN